MSLLIVLAVFADLENHPSIRCFHFLKGIDMSLVGAVSVGQFPFDYREEHECSVNKKSIVIHKRSGIGGSVLSS